MSCQREQLLGFGGTVALVVLIGIGFWQCGFPAIMRFTDWVRR